MGEETAGEEGEEGLNLGGRASMSTTWVGLIFTVGPPFSLEERNIRQGERRRRHDGSCGFPGLWAHREKGDDLRRPERCAQRRYVSFQ